MKNILFFTLFLSFSLHAKLLVVSDIDDTIKSTQMLSSARAFRNLFKDQNSFLKMSTLYKLIEEENDLAVIAYVSNAPKGFIASEHREFLRANAFAQRENFFNRNWGDVWGDDNAPENFKVRTITSLIQKHAPTRVLLIGDNGEKDIATYREIENKFPEIEVITYIHTVYGIREGKPLLEGQKPYVTALDLAIGLHLEEIISKEVLATFFEEHAPDVLAEFSPDDDYPQAFPRWMNCSVFNWPYELGDDLDNLAMNLRKKIQTECRK